MAFKLSANTRTVKGEKVRTKTVLPAVVYGMGATAASVTLNYDEFAKLFAEAGEASLIDLLLGDKAEGKVLVQDVQYDPVSDRMIHVDLRRIDMNKEMTATVELRFVGEAPVIKEQGGTLMRNLESVEVKCLPKDLVSHIDVDLTVLKTFDDVVKIKNLIVPAGITITNPHAEDLIAKATAALTEEEIKAMEESAKPADLTKIEVAGKKKEEEGEEGAEGAPKPEAGAGKEEKKEEKE
ncbi:MAG: large subunit ribosomal protein L25 [Parcubacteria group bacterium Gr01-1014_13]|nr:MAG: large subunit ribosomal protein L25 [Parcubacteria group bacterium Gr01-1014_13]